MALTLQNFAYAILGIVALAAMDLSSYCHPAPEAPDMPLIAKAGLQRRSCHLPRTQPRRSPSVFQQTIGN